MAQTPPPPPPRSRTGLYLGLGGAGLLLIGGAFFVLQQQAEENRRAAERAAHMAAERVAQETREASRKAEESARRAENEKVFLSVVSEPLGATVEATWKDGVRAGVTPFDLSVPKNMKVHFAFSKKEYLPYVQEVIADAPQVVKVALAQEPQARVAVARPGVSTRRPDESGKKAKPATDKDKEDIPLEF